MVVFSLNLIYSHCWGYLVLPDGWAGGQMDKLEMKAYKKILGHITNCLKIIHGEALGWGGGGGLRVSFLFFSSFFPSFL